ncbi:MAG: hypothetical protein HRT43_09020 [Campylobacteraceae bacterium]|nr:hypothetical protein [Campylobacteraceae bacterium]
MNLLEQFTQEKLIENLSSYEVYYQVSVGNLINETHVKSINGEVDLQDALSSIYEMIREIRCLDNALDIFDKELRKQAAMDAVQNFVNENLELVKSKNIEVEPLINDINDNLFFKEEMLAICKSAKPHAMQKWETIITPQITQAIQDSIKQL